MAAATSSGRRWTWWGDAGCICWNNVLHLKIRKCCLVLFAVLGLIQEETPSSIRSNISDVLGFVLVLMWDEGSCADSPQFLGSRWCAKLDKIKCVSEGEKFSVYYQLLLLVAMVMARGATFPGHTHTHLVHTLQGEASLVIWPQMDALNPAASTPEACRGPIRTRLIHTCGEKRSENADT